jgi:hypothetical protein
MASGGAPFVDFASGCTTDGLSRRLSPTSRATSRPISMALCDSKPPNAFHTPEPRRRDSAAKSSP